jgi:AcrR family transcriptional regulator
MARPTTIRDETILEAAREVFLARGIQATTAEVAERAGVSEGSIFNRFKSKEELFHAAMQSELGKPEWVKGLDRRVGAGEIREQLYDLGLEIIAFFRTVMPRNMMAWSNAPCVSGLPRHLAGPNPPPLRAVKAMVGFFEAEMRAGRMRRHDPEVLARTFMGALHGFVFYELLYKASDELPLAAEVFVRGLVHLIWTGAAPSRHGGQR